jgi:type IV pilus biogenesis protein PilP
VRPRPRPGNLIEQNERATLGGRSRGELGRLRPRPRPASPQAEAEAAALSAALSQSVDDAVQDALAAPPSSANAIAVSRKPRRRPSNFASLVEVARASARRNEAASVSAAVAAPQTQRSPTVASVARQATVEGAINLRRLNLIGVYGSSSDRRALIRLPSGRYVKVQVGDSLDGGQVSAISDTALRYTKGSKSFVLQMPSG